MLARGRLRVRGGLRSSPRPAALPSHSGSDPRIYSDSGVLAAGPRVAAAAAPAAAPAAALAAAAAAAEGRNRREKEQTPNH